MSPATDVRWERVGTVRASAQEWLKGVAAFRDGYVAIDGTATVQFSPDGVSWTKVRLPAGDAASSTASGIASDGERVVVVGGSAPCAEVAARCREVPRSWVSDDGRTWRGSDDWAEPAVPARFGAAPFWAVWAVPTGGWDATQVFLTEEPVVGPALWHSGDGLAWSMLRPLPAEPDAEGDPYWSAEWFVGLADGRGRRVARQLAYACDDGGYVLSTSPDGARYERLRTFPGTCQTVSGILAPVGTGSWVVVGEVRGDSDPGASVPVAWTSGDLLEWTTTPLALPPGLPAIVNDGVYALGHGGAGYVATGYVAPAAGDNRALTWLSGDGVTWLAADAAGSTGDSPVWILADGPAGLLGFGPEHQLSAGNDDESTFAVWRLVATD